MSCLCFGRKTSNPSKSPSDNARHVSLRTKSSRSSRSSLSRTSLRKDKEKSAEMATHVDRGIYFEDPPEPYWRTETTQQPPSYLAYNQPPNVEHPDFPDEAIEFALRASAPVQSAMAADLDKKRRVLTEEEQGQYYRSIKYGDQCNRGLDELRKFQEDLITEVAEATGLTIEEIERRRKLSSFDDEIETCDI